MILMLLFLPIFSGLFYFFNKKLIILLFLEISMILCIFLFFCSFSGLGLSFYFVIILTLFMVLESVFSLSTLICTSRNSSFLSLKFFSL